MPEARAQAMKSVSRALDVRFSIAEADPSLSAIAVTRELGLFQPTTYRILDTLHGRCVDYSISFNATINEYGPFGAVPDEERSGLPGNQ